MNPLKGNFIDLTKRRKLRTKKDKNSSFYIKYPANFIDFLSSIHELHFYNNITVYSNNEMKPVIDQAKNVESIYIQSEQKILESCFVCLVVVVLVEGQWVCV